MQTRKFQRKIEDFVCENCGFKVKGDGYTNHCPKCLLSKHVDVNPGDRLEACGGLMAPISVDMKAGEHILLQKCLKCGFERKNKVSKGDDFERVLGVGKF
jgi:predicted Zn-ribbon and HTH transcriptional regulator